MSQHNLTSDGAHINPIEKLYIALEACIFRTIRDIDVVSSENMFVMIRRTFLFIFLPFVMPNWVSFRFYLKKIHILRKIFVSGRKV